MEKLEADLQEEGSRIRSLVLLFYIRHPALRLLQGTVEYRAEGNMQIPFTKNPAIFASHLCRQSLNHPITSTVPYLLLHTS
jgi:hypothetical protein